MNTVDVDAFSERETHYERSNDGFWIPKTACWLSNRTRKRSSQERLDLAVKAHGGLDRWNKLTALCHFA
jgi:hypothetical protein